MKTVPSYTAYHFEGIRNTPLDPNRNRRFCRPCAHEHREYWDAMWAEYYNSIGY